MRTMRWRAEVNKHYGVHSEAVDAAFVKRGIPMIDMTCGGHAPIWARCSTSRALSRAMMRWPGATAAAPTVAASRFTSRPKSPAFELQGGRVVGVDTTRGPIATSRVLCAVAGFTPRVLDMVDLHTPIYVHPLQAMVSEPLKPWLDPIIVSGSLHVYVSQTARGELVMGASLDPYELHNTRSTLDFAEVVERAHARHVSLPERGQGQSPVGGTCRYDAGLCAHHGPHAGGRVSFSTPVGELGDSRRRRCAARP